MPLHIPSQDDDDPFYVNPLADEAAIIWLEDVSGYDYVREWLRHLPTRTGGPSWQGIEGRLVGYATLKPKARRSTFGFLRRCFFLKDHDRDRSPDDTYHAARPGGSSGGCPQEAVDPLTVVVGMPGVQNEKAWGGPKPTGKLKPLPKHAPPMPKLRPAEA